MSAFGDSAIRGGAVNEMKAVLDEARAVPWPDASLAFTDVQDVGAPTPAGAKQGAVP